MTAEEAAEILMGLEMVMAGKLPKDHQILLALSFAIDVLEATWDEYVEWKKCKEDYERAGKK